MGQFEEDRLGLVLAAFTFDNVPSTDHKAHLLSQLASRLKPRGRIVNLVSSPEIYRHEWASFSTKGFPENQIASSGDLVKIIMTDVDDSRPVEDIVCTEGGYRNVYEEAGRKTLATNQPLGTEDEPFSWVNETSIAPWTIYVLGNSIG